MLQGLRYYFPLAVVAAVLWGLYAQRGSDAERDRQASDDQAVLGNCDQLLSRRLAEATADLRFVANSLELANVVDGASPAKQDQIAALFTALMTQKPDYARLRLLDGHGIEVVRVDRRANALVRIAAADLQNTSGRDFFEGARIMQPGTVFVSRFDLNVEHGQIQIPYRPMLRLSTPLRSASTPAFVLVLNYNGQALLDALKRTFASSTAQGMLVDDEGYWLYHPDAALRWGFLLHTERNMPSRYPLAWARMQDARGMVETSEGSFAQRPVFPLRQLVDLVGGVVDRGWRVVLYRAPPSLRERIEPFLAPPFWVIQALLLLIVLLWAQQQQRETLRREKTSAEEALRAQATAGQNLLREQLFRLMLSVQEAVDPASFARILLSELARLLQVSVGAAYRLEGEWLRPLAGYGLPDDLGLRQSRLGESLLGEAVRDRRRIRLDTLPPAYLDIDSALGRSPPAQLLIVPLWVRDHDIGVLELGLSRPLDAAQTQLLDQAIPLLALHLATHLQRASSRGFSLAANTLV